MKLFWTAVLILMLSLSLGMSIRSYNAWQLQPITANIAGLK